MRIARTKGVSDRIAQPRRGVSLRPVKEEPEKASPEPPRTTQDIRDAFARLGTSTQEASRALADTATAMGGFLNSPAGQAALRRGVPPRVMGVDFASGPDSMAVAQYRTEEIPEDTRVVFIARDEVRDMMSRGFSFTDEQIAHRFAGPVPEGYTREVTREWDGRVQIVDHRPRSWRNVLVGAPTGPTFPAHDFDRESYQIIRVTYEAAEDAFGRMTSIHTRNSDILRLPWDRIVGTYPVGVELVEVYMDISDRTYQLAFRRTR